MHRLENKTARWIFLTTFCMPSNAYPTNFWAHKFLVPTLKLKNVSIEFPLETSYFEQHFDSSRKKGRKSSKTADYCKGKTFFNDK